MSMKKVIIVALAALPLAGCVADGPGYHRDYGYRDYDYDYRYPNYGYHNPHHDHDRDRDRDRNNDRDRDRNDDRNRNAGVSPRTVDIQQDAHQRRIEQGVRSGEITAAEQRRLQAEQRSIRDQEAAYRADGRLTAAEEQALRRRQEAAARNISREGNDKEDVRPRQR